MNKRKWMSVALLNLGLVAALGFLMRSKMIFNLPGLNFKNLLEAHSHFAFGGWVTLALFVLMTYELLPAASSSRRVYQLLFGAVLLCNYGMLVSFASGGYTPVSLVFSTFFLLVCGYFACVFSRDILRAGGPRLVRATAFSSLAYLVLSASGPFMLAVLKTVRSTDFILYKDAVYTFLHFQYNGFFTLAVLALALKRVGHHQPRLAAGIVWLVNASVLPSLAISFLWHEPPFPVFLSGCLGAALMFAAGILASTWLFRMRRYAAGLAPVFRFVAYSAAAAFTAKLFVLSLAVIPGLGHQVFVNRPLIIGFLHLALLMFVTLYLLWHTASDGTMPFGKAGKKFLGLFSFSVVANELVLFTQGVAIMLGYNSPVFNWLLWLCAAGLLGGAALLARAPVHQLYRSFTIRFQIIYAKRLKYVNHH